MRKLLLLLLFISVSVLTFAQTKSYLSSSGEMIFSFANIKQGGNNIDSKLRWSPVFNWQLFRNHDFTQHFGLFYGFAIRNVGFVYDIPNSDTLKKYRTYNVGIPVGIKLGNIESGTFVYGGYEFEMPFHYKEKTFVNGDKKDKITAYFTDRVNWYTQSAFVGINFKRGLNIKFKYYLDNFFNPDYSEVNSINVRVKPFSDFNAHVFYFALQFNPFKDWRSYYTKQEKPAPKKADERYSYSYQ
jgi:hypothetical protein